MTLKPVFNPFTGTFDYVDIAAAQATPTLISSSSTFTIPADTQMLFRAPCQIDGTLVITGTMVDL